MKRREFMKESWLLCITSGAGILASGLASCASYPVYETVANGNTIAVPRILIEREIPRLVRVKDFPYDIALRLDAQGNCQALLLRCTHADNQLTLAGSGYYCSLHGSTFDRKGDVTHGPAQRPLQSLRTEVTPEHVTIHLPIR